MKRLELLDQTLIIFISDNGGVYRVSRQWPLRAGKGSYYEGGIREPMFVYWPDRIGAGQICNTPVSNLDFFPTLVEITGAKAGNTLLDGKSILPLIDGEPFEDRPLFWHFPFYLEGGNSETQDTIFRTRPGSAIRFQEWKLIWYFENDDLELYDLQGDPSEKQNLASRYPDQLNELKDMLIKWQVSINAPVPEEINPEWVK